MNGQKEADQALNGKGIDEKEDFLQQIRAKVSDHFFFVIWLASQNPKSFCLCIEEFHNHM